MKKGRRSLVVFLSVLLVLVQAHADLPSIEIPPELGRITSKHPGTNGKTILLIQEAHVDYGAQKAIAEILRELIQKHSLRLILVEGGWGDVSLDYMKNYGTQTAVIEVAERHFKEGKISAEEYLNLTSDLKMSLWGIENPDYYAGNMKAFLALDAARGEIQTELEKFETTLDQQKEKILSEPLKQFFKTKQSFEQRETSLPGYLKFLRSISQGRNLDQYPHLKQLLSMVGEGGAFDPDKVEVEKKALIQAFARVLTKPELDRIALLASRKNPQEEVERLKSILAAYKRHETKLDVDVHNLAAYAQALEGMVAGDPEVIFNELKAFEKSVLETVAGPEEKKLIDQIEHFELLKKLLTLELSANEFATLDTPSPSPLPLLGGEGKSEGAAILSKYIPLAKSFYESAHKRETAMIENAANKMEHDGELTAVLIAGGFHADSLTKSLNEKGYTVVSITPRFTPADSKIQQQHYFNILKYKWGQGPTNPTQGGIVHNANR